MYAIFEIGGKQYKAAAGDVVRAEKLPDAVGTKIKFDKVLVLNDGKETHIGTPYLDAAVVSATVTAVGKGDKVIVFKYKAKKGYRKKQGHRQPFTEVEVESVSLAGKTVFKKEAPKKADKPAPKEKSEEEKQEKPADAEKPEAKDDGKKPDESGAAPVETEAGNAAETAGDGGKKSADAEKPKAKDDGKKPDAAAAPSKMTKADIMAKLDELGASYAKSAKKDELLAILAEAEKK
jgi:large subunit ribosomal protein L21